METKKNQSANIEKLRTPIGLTALLFTGSIVLASFTYTSGLEQENSLNTAANTSDIQFMEEIVTPPTPPEPMSQQEVILPPSDVIRVDSNQQKEIKPIVVVIPPVVKIVPPTIKEKGIIEWPDVEARFDGGAAAMQAWIAQNVQYPQTSIEMNEQGKVYLSFVVEEDGSISNIMIERGVSSDLDREAKRLLRKMPKWIPGEAKGEKVRARCRLPINFTLN
ncbi:MAG: hypothetical protein A3D92_17750 [Bacteroidetes bacterium RIFCSPHIGHO2_02_FULL_44_7]|nr:MAG: hypothetical protein A3D92_17750 [Bacteroidetes bacterium RIFCSPHIGHO2_02_FULL_44_7]